MRMKHGVPQLHEVFLDRIVSHNLTDVVYPLAMPSLIACLVRERRRPARRGALERMAATVFPYIADELQSPESAGAVSDWLEHLVSAGLLVRTPDDTFAAPPAGSPEHFRLRLLARLIMPTLERLYIVVGVLFQAGQGAHSRESLQERSHRIAQKMSRLYGLNAPEFFDARLFNRFVDALVDNGVVQEGDDGRLTWAPVVEDVMKASEGVIDPDFRYAVRQED